ncbi:glycoside hydrolase family 32 protein [Sphingobacterium faecium]|uniref:glycoside hydrolase family 32 protein n=1 Tax=Sphingobacterium faecium TaxID=34087 RepID=UPI003208BB7E
MMKKLAFILLALPLFSYAQTGSTKQDKQMVQVENYRPLYHFTPKEGWMNDPNGMVYNNGTYHLFYQHNPDEPKWGPMHWGHATSTDLVHWEEQKIALYPDSLGTIFSGSAVIDKDNTAGFGKDAMVAIFTHHNHKEEDKRTGLHQYQSLAYSLDQGKTWEKYKGNPVLPNPGIWDFRDPKVMWHEKSQAWIMTLATKDCITFYSSKNLKEWEIESSFGKEIGAHGGVWECPDLFPMTDNGVTKWILLVSINPGGPNGGSATQYFVGDFDGKHFTTDDTQIKWLDWGTDNYAGVTWNNVKNRHLFIGWMSNWQYANEVPTLKWRSASTIPRELSLTSINKQYYVASKPAKEIENAFKISKTIATKKVNEILLSDHLPTGFQLDISKLKVQDFKIILFNKEGNELTVGYNKAKDQYFINRSESGNISFSHDFPKKHVAPRLSKESQVDMNVFFDVTSVEFFADNGLSVMTDIFFPDSPMTHLKITSNAPLEYQNIIISEYKK